jgi:hypothetical protein
MHSKTQGEISRRVLMRSARLAGAILVICTLSACLGDGSDDSTALAPLTPSAAVTCGDYNGNPVTIAPKTVTIYNNTAANIYPVLTTSPNGANEWIQACKRAATAFPTNLVYKLYVNQGSGIPAGSSVTITLPLYSEIYPGAAPQGMDKYITWWNGGRVILADKNTRLLDTTTTDPNAVDTETATPAAVTCRGQSTSCQLTTYYSKVQPPVNIYAQLSEYTFGAVGTPAGQTTPLLIPDNVGYNISYVDHVYLPVAIEPASNPYIGYSGSAMNIADFDTAVANFLAPGGTDAGWPVYNLAVDLAAPHYKLPGGYNIFAERAGRENAAGDMPVQPTTGNPFTLTTVTCIKAAEAGTQCTDAQQAQPYGKAVQTMQDVWGYCVNWGTDQTWKQFVSDPNADPATACSGLNVSQTMKDDLQLIHDFFAANYQTYINTAYPGPGCSRIAPAVPFDFYQSMKHIYGWVPFNDNCSNAGLNPLADTTVQFKGKNWTHAQVQPLYINQLQYNYKNPVGNTDPIFNPYVKLIHEDLQMNAYGFSVDDSVGFMQELGSGLIFAVGSPNGLPNPGQFDYKGGFSMMLGDPPNVAPNQQLIKSYGVCVYPNGKVDPAQCTDIKQDVIMPTETKILGFRIGTVADYPIRVSFTDLDGNVYSYDVIAPFGDPVAGPPGSNPVPSNAAAIKTAFTARCTITNPDPSKAPNAAQITAWCGGPNPNIGVDPHSTDTQTAKNFIGVPMPAGRLPL